MLFIPLLKEYKVSVKDEVPTVSQSYKHKKHDKRVVDNMEVSLIPIGKHSMK